MEKITENKKCYGCTACYSICPKKAIEMVEDEKGFKHPVINNKKCINCGLCKKNCPANYGLDQFVSDNNLPKIYAARTKNEEVREKSTSGGMFSEISNYILNKDGVIFGTVMDENFKVKYIKVKDKKGRDLLRGAKYVQSDLENTFTEIKKELDEKKYVMFIGNPCYVAGLKSFLGKNNYENLLLCDIVCHGVPSPLIFKEHVEYIKNKHKLKKYIFRNKLIGWRGTNTTIEYDNTYESNTPYSDIFTNLYFDGYITRECCSSCKFTSINRVSDITIGDFWGIEKSHPKFNDEKGTSLLIINSKKGENILENIKNNIYLEESSVEKCLQPQLKYPSAENKNKLSFWNDYKKRGFHFVAKKYTIFGFKKRLIKSIKKIIPNNVKEKLKGRKV